jgi:hypothetical protein
MVRRDGRPGLSYHLAGFVGPAPHPGDAVGPGDWKVGLQCDLVSRRDDDLDPGGGLRAVVIGELDKGGRHWHGTILAAPGPNSPLCDTAGVAPLSRRLRRIEEPRMAAIGLAVAMVALLAAYGYALTATAVTADGVVAAAVLVGIAGTGLLYAWRAVTGASGD